MHGNGASTQHAAPQTDWHRLNVKRRLAKQPPISEDAFEQLLAEHESEVSSISGSDSESASDEEDNTDESGAVASSSKPRTAPNNIPQVVFTAPDGKLFSVWRCLLTQQDAAKCSLSGEELLAALQRLRSNSAPWIVILLRGGHFAAGVFKPRVVASSGPAGGGREQAAGELFEVVAHKTFHRYVVRAKAGGKQSSKDASGKFARSAGSQLRRYNEAALNADIQQLLASWGQLIQEAQLVFVHAPSSNLKSIFPPSSTALQASDPRVRRIPFTTGRPTFSETKHVVGLLATVFEPQVQPAEDHQFNATAAATAATGDAEKQQTGPAQASPAPAANHEREAGQEASSSDEGEEPGEQGQHAKHSHGQEETPLHKAARLGDAHKVTALLTAGHDPCEKNASSKTPYAVAKDKAVRDAMRRFMATEPDKWDYEAAGIPSPLTEDLEVAQAAKRAEKKARQKAKEQERKAAAEERERKKRQDELSAIDGEIARAAAEAAALSARASTSRAAAGQSQVGPNSNPASTSAPRQQQPPKGKGKPSPATQQQQQQQQALSPEEVARRRELMAAAAEARMKALQAAAQQQKLWSVLPEVQGL